MLELNVSLIVQGFIVGGLLATAGVLFKTVIKLAELGRDVTNLDQRVGRLEDQR